MTNGYLQAICGPGRDVIELSDTQGHCHLYTLYPTLGPLGGGPLFWEATFQSTNDTGSPMSETNSLSSKLRLSPSHREKNAGAHRRRARWQMNEVKDGFGGLVSCLDSSVLQMCAYWSAWLKVTKSFLHLPIHVAFPGRSAGRLSLQPQGTCPRVSPRDEVHISYLYFLTQHLLNSLMTWSLLSLMGRVYFWCCLTFLRTLTLLLLPFFRSIQPRHGCFPQFLLHTQPLSVQSHSAQGSELSRVLSSPWVLTQSVSSEATDFESVLLSGWFWW